MTELDPHEVAGGAAAASHRDGTAVLRLSGEVDLSTFEEMRATADALIRQNPSGLVIDLTDVTFMDSSGIALLLWIANHQPRTELRNPSPMVMQVIEMTGLTEMLPIAP